MLSFRSLVTPTVLILTILVLYSPAVASDYREPTTGMEFVLIQGGKFDMGDISSKDLTASPAHRVTVPDFYMGVYEVTFDQYDQFCEATDREKPDDAGWGRGNRPVINVNWYDAVAFTEWLSKKTGRKFRLPSEAEWEYAARAGTTTRYWWGNQPGTNNANCKDCGSRWDDKMTAPVGSFSANPWGLYDIIGNVSEWLLDTRHENYVGAPTDGSAWIENGNDQFRMDRSGYWHSYVIDLKSWDRSYHLADNPKTNIGIRVVLEP